MIRTVRQQITDRIRSEVMCGGYTAGQPLRETNLAKQFGVSRGPVRDALLQLSQEGLLEYQPNVGVKVGTPPEDSAREMIVGIRRRLEVWAASNGFENFDERGVQRLRDALLGLKSACDSQEPARIVEADVRFHEALLRACGQESLLPMWKAMCAGMRFAYTRLNEHGHIYDEHAAIVEAIENRDAEAAVRALEANII